ncbi:HAMP domain-containing protein [Calothrix anomala FACHB-343]|uniref:histidine kinase n=3 Tax=Calotrichaceae TaxID=2661849 RepID=A0ABR8AFB8_9CYAN|nr:HAMP domain-containing protein [Calothrix parietina FACHB-288]MBD2227032.1 HAMP domain-containing protein [Calothrix anomala FACHB-343]
MAVIKRKPVKRIFLWFSNLSNSWDIAQKISYGYTVAISIAFVGTIIGLLHATQYETNAQKQLNLSYQQQYLLKDLENAVTRIRLHPQRLVTVLDNSVWLEFEKNKFLDELSQVNQQLLEIEKFINAYPNDLALNSAEILNLLKNYQKNIEIYNQIVQFYWQQIEKKQLSPKAKSDYQEQLFFLFKEEKKVNLSVKFEQLSDELIRLIGQAEIQKQEANTSFENVKNLRMKVIFGSMILSSAIAAALAIYTSKLIAHPLEVVTKVARKIIQESNFQLRANVTSKDEVGTLATSLNQLVEWVGDYTQELELARQHLEQRVKERTQELQHSYQTLEQRVEERTQELKQALQDLKATQAQLIQTEKMSSLGQMVAGIAHEINNPINFIYGNIRCADEYIQDLLNLINLYEQQYPESNCIIEERIEDIDFNFLKKDLLKLLDSMKIGAERIREIVLSLRNFSRLDEADIKEVDIHEGIDNTLLILSHRIKSDITVLTNYRDLPLVECYPAQINQVFMNILSNAIDALLELESQTTKQIFIETSKLDDTYIKVGIRDNGPGIPPEIRNKLFDPFFTTKPVGKGTGLGLSICYQIIDKHKGRIELASEVGKGTEFAILLPIKTQI